MPQEVIETALRGTPDMAADPIVQARKRQLIDETYRLLDQIRALGDGHPDPLSDPAVLTRAYSTGLLDAPQLVNNPFALGRVRTRSVNGAILPF